MHVLHAERIWMQGVLLVYVLGGWCWREYAVSVRTGVPGDAGMVPLSSRETAKGGKEMTQLALLKQVSSFFQRIHPRAKRKPDPRIKALHPRASPLGSSGRKEKDTTRCAQTSVVDFLTQSPVS